MAATAASPAARDVAIVDGAKPVPKGKEEPLLDPDEGYVDERTNRQQWIEFTLICLCNVAWTIDSGLLPMFFTEFQALFHVSQTSLSLLSTVKGWVAALFAFPCGFMGELVSRPRLVGMGMLVWATGLALCAGAGSFEMLFFGRVLNGVGLGVVQPLLLSLVADKNPPSKRGSAFGSLFFTGAVCNTVFGLVATRYAASYVGSVEGWRLSIAAVVVLSAVTGLLVTLFVSEPNAAHLAERRKTMGFCSVFVKNMPKVIQLFKYPTFVLILLQGAPGTAPWTVFPFFTQWLELSCFTHEQAALIFASFGWGSACSNLVSGGMLNFVARRYPDHGPPSIANFSVAIGIPFLLLFFFVLPKPADLGDGSTSETALFAVTFLFFGLGASMCGTLNKKIFSDIVPPQIFTYVFAIDQLIENTVGNFAGLAVGLITDNVFHYHSDRVKEGECAPQEAKALGMGMFVVCLVAWAICFSVYTFLHCTYPKDRRVELERRHAELRAKLAAKQALAGDVELASAGGAAAEGAGAGNNGGEPTNEVPVDETEQVHEC